MVLEPTIPDPTFIERTRVLPVRHVASGFPVDVVLGAAGLEQIFADGATPIRVGRASVPVASPTHLLVMKILASRPKDLEDATALLRSLGDEIDTRAADQMVRSIAQAVGEDDILDALARVRAQASR